MNAKSLIAAAAVFVCTGTAFAAETPAAAAASATTGASGTSAGASASGLNLPTLGAPSRASRDDVKAEAVDFLKDYKTALSVQLDQYKN